MKSTLIALLLLTLQLQAEWSPPVKPDPSSILQEAEADTRAGRFEDALQKHIWYHENALKFQRAQYGVRLSFALSAWWELASKYPPAMEALRRARDTAEANVRSKDGKFDAFHDAVSLNETLGESQRTVTLFKWVDENRPSDAKLALSVAEPDLIKAREYTLCGKYLEPETDFKGLLQGFRENLKMSKQKQFKSMKDFGEKKFSSDAGTLVALLVLNHRKDEAKTIRDKAIQEWHDKDFQELLDKALEGEIPRPFPDHGA